MPPQARTHRISQRQFLGLGESQIEKCLFGLVRSPSISLSEIELYGFSEYWFSLENVLFMGGQYDFSKTASRARQFCHMKWSTIQTQYRNNVYPKADEDRLRSQCFKSAWITAVLHEGFLISKTYNRFRSVLDVNGQEAHWALGALLYHMRYFPLSGTTHKPQHPNYQIAGRRIPAYWIISLVLLVVIKQNHMPLHNSCIIEPFFRTLDMLSQRLLRILRILKG